MLNKEVTQLLDDLKHPLRAEIELLRNYILAADAGLTENIKWNGPNYCLKNEDRVTMRVQPVSKHVQLIFHQVSKKQEPLPQKLIETQSKLFVWKENDRAVITFKNLLEIETAELELKEIVSKWIYAKQ